eukprot:TRINITY_DN12769_c0_g1_i1.p1 TRINITY_DN12769_c0_g1~~TRINITY_DN12769_c0_g1_i1.p1  ORF type:complete len:1733 (+),score=413.33 TRINITY_DN12769_c0_g1_i1:76-5199(+)
MAAPELPPRPWSAGHGGSQQRGRRRSSQQRPATASSVRPHHPSESAARHARGGWPSARSRPLSAVSRSSAGSVGYSTPRHSPPRGSSPTRTSFAEPAPSAADIAVGPRPTGLSDLQRMRLESDALRARRLVADSTAAPRGGARPGGCGVVLDLTEGGAEGRAAADHACGFLRAAGLRCCPLHGAGAWGTARLLQHIGSSPSASESVVVLWVLAELNQDGEVPALPGSAMAEAEAALVRGATQPRHILWVIDGGEVCAPEDAAGACCPQALPIACHAPSSAARAARSAAAAGAAAAPDAGDTVPSAFSIAALCCVTPGPPGYLGERLLQGARSGLLRSALLPAAARSLPLAALAAWAEGAETGIARVRWGWLPPPRGPALPPLLWGPFAQPPLPVPPQLLPGGTAGAPALSGGGGGECPAGRLPTPLAAWWRERWGRQGGLPWELFAGAAAAVLGDASTPAKAAEWAVRALRAKCGARGVVTPETLAAAAAAAGWTGGASVPSALLQAAEGKPPPPAKGQRAGGARGTQPALVPGLLQLQQPSPCSPAAPLTLSRLSLSVQPQAGSPQPSPRRGASPADALVSQIASELRQHCESFTQLQRELAADSAFRLLCPGLARVLRCRGGASSGFSSPTSAGRGRPTDGLGNEEDSGEDDVEAAVAAVDATTPPGVSPLLSPTTSAPSSPREGAQPTRRRSHLHGADASLIAAIGHGAPTLRDVAARLCAGEHPKSVLETLLSRPVSGPQDAADGLWRLQLPDAARSFAAALRICRQLWGGGEHGAQFGTVPSVKVSLDKDLRDRHRQALKLSQKRRERQPELPADLGRAAEVDLPDGEAERKLMYRIASLWVRQRNHPTHRHLPLLWPADAAAALGAEPCQPRSLAYTVSVLGGYARVTMRATFAARPPAGPGVTLGPPRREKLHLRPADPNLRDRLTRVLRKGAAAAPSPGFMLTLPVAPGRVVESVEVRRGPAVWRSRPGEGGSAEERALGGAHEASAALLSSSALLRAYANDAILVPCAGALCGRPEEALTAELLWSEPLHWNSVAGCYCGPTLPAQWVRGLGELAPPAATSRWLQQVLSVRVTHHALSPLFSVHFPSRTVEADGDSEQWEGGALAATRGSRLARSGNYPNADMEVRLTPPEGSVLSAVVTATAQHLEGREAGFAGGVAGCGGGLLLVHAAPPREVSWAPPPRRFRQALVFLVDCSHQMSDTAVAAAGQGVLAGLGRLGPSDAVGLLRFTTQPLDTAESAPEVRVAPVGGAGGDMVRETVGKGRLRSHSITAEPVTVGLVAALEAAAAGLAPYTAALRTVVIIAAGSCAGETALVETLSCSTESALAGVRLRFALAGPFANRLFCRFAAARSRAAAPQHATAGTPAELAAAVEAAAAAAAGTWLRDVRVSAEGPVGCAEAEEAAAPPPTPAAHRRGSAPPVLHQVSWQLPNPAPDLSCELVDVVCRYSGPAPERVVISGTLPDGCRWEEAVPVALAPPAAPVAAVCGRVARPHADAAVWADLQDLSAASAPAAARRPAVDLVIRPASAGDPDILCAMQAAAAVADLCGCLPDAVSVQVLAPLGGRWAGGMHCRVELTGDNVTRLLRALAHEGGAPAGPWIVDVACAAPPEGACLRRRRQRAVAELCGDGARHQPPRPAPVPLPLGNDGSGGDPAGACCHSELPLPHGSRWAAEAGLAACNAAPSLAPARGLPTLRYPPF